jgi:hypothetical protein
MSALSGFDRVVSAFVALSFFDRVVVVAIVISSLFPSRGSSRGSLLADIIRVTRGPSRA